MHTIVGLWWWVLGASMVVGATFARKTTVERMRCQWLSVQLKPPWAENNPCCQTNIMMFELCWCNRALEVH
jgi:hypothetical protein